MKLIDGIFFVNSPHLCSTKRLKHTKVLDFQGLFVFLRAFFRVEIFLLKNALFFVYTGLEPTG